MNVIIDTNVILDDILNRTPNVTDARRITELVTEGKIAGHISANSITDIYYVTDKKHGDDVAKDVIRGLLQSFSIVAIGGEACLAALDKPMDDFEDALVAVCAENANLNYIITNDKAFLDLDLPVPSINPTDFLTVYAGLVGDK